MIEQSDPRSIKEILTLISKEKFRRQMIMVSKLIAIGLVLAIIWVGWVNYVYAKDVNKIMSKYGAEGYCYMCGKETYKKCECQYAGSFGEVVNYTLMAEMTSNYNLQKCIDKDLIKKNDSNLPFLIK